MDTERVVATNRRARYDYDVLETYEVGLVLAGAEVKSLRAGKVSLGDAYAAPQEGEIFLFNLHIPPYDKNTLTPLAPRRPRKLLVNRRELHRIARAVDQKGVTLIPLKLYFSRGYAKIQLALARGKKKYDKRERILEKDERRLAEK
jgi:SsrA-binding protein